MHDKDHLWKLFEKAFKRIAQKKLQQLLFVHRV